MDGSTAVISMSAESHSQIARQSELIFSGKCSFKVDSMSAVPSLQRDSDGQRCSGCSGSWATATHSVLVGLLATWVKRREEELAVEGPATRGLAVATVTYKERH